VTHLTETLAADLITRCREERKRLHVNDRQQGEFTIEEYRESLSDDNVTYMMAKWDLAEMLKSGIVSRRRYERRLWLWRFVE
jgi:hypothetical protein